MQGKGGKMGGKCKKDPCKKKDRESRYLRVYPTGYFLQRGEIRVFSGKTLVSRKNMAGSPTAREWEEKNVSK